MLYENMLLKALLHLSLHHPERTVLQNGRKILTAETLLNKSKLLALHLSEKGLKDGDVVLLALFPGEDFLVIFFALLMLRARIAIIDNEMGEENYAAKMLQLKPGWLFSDSRLLLLTKYPALKRVAGLLKKNLPRLELTKHINIISTGYSLPFFFSKNRFKNLFTETVKNIELIPNDQEYECAIIYTSGTLSVPKAVVHTDHSLKTTLENLGKIFTDDTNVVLATYLPHFILLGIACNFCVKIVRPELKAAKKLAWFEKEKITVYFGAPYDYLPLIESCEKTNTLFPSCLQHLIAGSAPVHKSFLKRLIKVLPAHVKISCTYGMTEHLVTAVADGREKISYESDGDLLGKIAEGVTIQIAEDNEICIRSKQLFKRYLHQWEGLPIHASGDLGKLDEHNNLILYGRKKDMIIRRDFNIYPALYEDTVRKIAGVSEAAFVGVYDETIFDEKVYLIVEGETADTNEILKQLKTGIHSIDTEALPDVIIKATMPRSGRHHKIDKIQIAAMIKNKTL